MEHITLSGHTDAFPLDPAAKPLLLSYLTAARDAVAGAPDGDETVRDIETALGDRFRSVLDEGAIVLDAPTMRRILDEAGPVEEIGPLAPEPAPKLCRIEEGKWFGGLVLGISTRSDLRVDWTRTMALFLCLITGGLLGVAYLIALPFTTKIATVAEYKAALERDQLAARRRRSAAQDGVR